MCQLTKFFMLLSTLYVSSHICTMSNKPAGIITHQYVDEQGHHLVTYKAYSAGTFKQIQASARHNKRLALLSLPGTILVAGGASLVFWINAVLWAVDGYSKDINSVPTFLVGGTLTAACALFGARAGFKTLQAHRMLRRYVSDPRDIKAALPDKHPIRTGSHDLFVDSHTTKPLEDSITK